MLNRETALHVSVVTWLRRFTMLHTAPAQRHVVVVFLSTLCAVPVFSTSASAQEELFFDETAEAFWQVPHRCADGAIVQATLLVRSTRDFEAPDRDDPDPAARVQFLAVCLDGRSFSWAALTAPAVITSTENLKSVTAVGKGTARDNLGGTHQVTFDVAWTGDGPLVVTTNDPGRMRKRRNGSATGQVTFDGNVIVDGAANHPSRPAPFIRVDTER
ncbi:MAG TPA: hypothetical protein VKC35_02755 [Vicinamibacterales bacterium]|nr:hypothetical protein [Vicinamibacterales bacterium]